MASCRVTLSAGRGDDHAAVAMAWAERSLVGRAPAEARMRAHSIIEGKIPGDRRACLGHAVVGARIGLYLIARHSRSTKTFSRQAPLPSILMDTLAAASTPVNSRLMNWLPWSMLKISGRPCLARASSSDATQNAASIVIETRWASTAG